MFNPLEQFKMNIIFDLLNNKYIDLTLSWGYIYILLVFIIIFSNTIYLLNINLNKLNYLIIIIINKINKLFIDILKLRNNIYLPFITYSFIYVVICNIIGLIPYSYTLTSQLIITLLWSTTIIISVTFIGIKLHKYNFIYLFIPNNVPILLIPYIMIIEIISYLSRILSLSIRLSTNMIAGHILIYIISYFGSFYAIPLLIAILILEIGVSIIQAYVLTLLMTTYIKDSIELH